MKKILLFLSIIYCFPLLGQVGINNVSPNVTLEVTAKKIDGSTSEGIIAPRLTGDALHQAELNNKYGVLQDGTIAYVTAVPSAANSVGQTISIDAKGYYYFDSTQNKWMKFRCGCSDQVQATLTDLICSTATITGSLTSGSAVTGVSVSVPYIGGNGGSYSSQTVTSTGVTGLTATLAAGTLVNGPGSVVYSISGTPSASGTASFPISLGGKPCALDIPVGSPTPAVVTINSGGSGQSGEGGRIDPRSSGPSQVDSPPVNSGNFILTGNSNKITFNLNIQLQNTATIKTGNGSGSPDVGTGVRFGAKAKVYVYNVILV